MELTGNRTPDSVTTPRSRVPSGNSAATGNVYLQNMATTTTLESKPAAKTLAENVKDTLESIVVAFILAFIFRAFIVEAFVIPTGSMAVTLYGNQITKTCSTCGFEYAVGITERPPPYPPNLRCPNCDT